MENTNSDLLVEYQGRFYPIIWRKKGEQDGKTDPCPFCGHEHYHGKWEGHRAAHCGIGKGDDLKLEGKTQLVEHGYFLKEY